MTRMKRIALTLLVPAAVAVLAIAYADSNEDKPGHYKLLTTISIPDLVGFDISWVDSESAVITLRIAERGTRRRPRGLT